MADPTAPVVDEPGAEPDPTATEPAIDAPKSERAYEVFEVIEDPDNETTSLLFHGVEAAANPDDAIWQAVERNAALRDLALSDTPPLMRAANAGKGGLSEAKPYKLEQAIRRATS